MVVVYNDARGESYYYYYQMEFTFEWVCNTGPAVVRAEGFHASTYLTLPPAGTYERMYSEKATYSWLIPCTGTLDIAASSINSLWSSVSFDNSKGSDIVGKGHLKFDNWIFNDVKGNFKITLTSFQHFVGGRDSVYRFAWSCGGTRPDFPSHDLTPAPETPAPDTATPTNLPAGASSPPGTSAPDTSLPTATPTDQPAGATFAPSAPAVNALCTTDKDCRSGRLDPKATCNAGTCVCHTQGYVHPPGVPLCLLADDVTVSPQPEESGGSSNVVLYVGIGVGVLVVAVCVVAAFCRLQKKQRATVLENHVEMCSTEGDMEETEYEGGSELDLF